MSRRNYGGMHRQRAWRKGALFLRRISTHTERRRRREHEHRDRETHHDRANARARAR